MTRVRRGDADYSRRTGNLLYLSVIHEDARPVGSDVPDPMLHAHNYIFNLTWDQEEGRLKAVDLHDVLKRADTIDALFLSDGLQRLGIGTERTADNRSFDITAVKGKEIFSKRRNEILKEEFGNRDRIETLARYRVPRCGPARQDARLRQGQNRDQERDRQSHSQAQGGAHFRGEARRPARPDDSRDSGQPARGSGESWRAAQLANARRSQGRGALQRLQEFLSGSRAGGGGPAPARCRRRYHL
jgi:TrwC relaxase